MRIILFAALTAAKQKEAARWNTPHTLTFCQWALTFLNVARMELNYIVQSKMIINVWPQNADGLKDMTYPVF